MKPEFTLNELSQFLNNLRQIEAEAHLNHLGKEKERWSKFFTSLTDADKIDAANREILAPHFNIFATLKIMHLEDTVHSPFLANLLNPVGTHSQSSFFFNEFITYVLPETDLHQIDEIQIIEEYSTYNGIFDIFIRFTIEGRPFFIVIENKIYAGDQPQQLKRYYEALKNLFSVKDNFMLIYLTPDGKLPSEVSLPHQLYKELKVTKKIRCLSYHHDITTILTGCMEKVKATVVKETIAQYLKTIKRL